MLTKTSDKLNQLTQVDRGKSNNPGRVITDYTYDSAGRLVDINHKSSNPGNLTRYRSCRLGSSNENTPIPQSGGYANG